MDEGGVRVEVVREDVIEGFEKVCGWTPTLISTRFASQKEEKPKKGEANAQYTNLGLPSSISTQLGAENANHTLTSLVEASEESSRMKGERFERVRRREG
jgi:hypothetical protein